MLDNQWDLPKVKLQLFAAGYCKHPEWVTIRGGKLGTVSIPAIFALIEHPVVGYILWDTGYSERFLKATDRMPNRLYRLITPVSYRSGDSAVKQLQAQGIAPEDIKIVILSHLHADHIAGLRDFPKATFMYVSEAYESVKRLRGLAAVRRAFLPELLPSDFEARTSLIMRDRRVGLPADAPFPYVLDVLGDGSLLAVDLPGHADGQIGLFLSTAHSDYFLCADAAWSREAVQENRPPHALAGVIMPNKEQYKRSFERIVNLHVKCPQLRIIPSHCPEVWSWIRGGVEL
ncbi:MBL fold metallo-hydrolase [Paenibacillus sp. SYP-B3998]|uniref:MBL fold metallo-hydrolase n=1 Tax=Paenibacillus sp. SYP-B3998 TaxID=2678564 RepID=A0A6G3ZWF3_9BACL|nr:MBL fold metallo-hydrolase [Paenibacillus sp. SYP-B3998]NEW05747.1 MBL fold metallo-hydrolase [Paenibacillus sp. SYP-B3998]